MRCQFAAPYQQRWFDAKASFIVLDSRLLSSLCQFFFATEKSHNMCYHDILDNTRTQPEIRTALAYLCIMSCVTRHWHHHNLIYPSGVRQRKQHTQKKESKRAWWAKWNQKINKNRSSLIFPVLLGSAWMFHESKKKKGKRELKRVVNRLWQAKRHQTCRVRSEDGASDVEINKGIISVNRRGRGTWKPIWLDFYASSLRQ